METVVAVDVVEHFPLERGVPVEMQEQRHEHTFTMCTRLSRGETS